MKLFDIPSYQFSVGLFDAHALFTDMLARPEDYLNGTAPLNTTGAVHACVFQLHEDETSNGTCTDVVGTDRDSFLWYVVSSLKWNTVIEDDLT